MVHGYYIVDVGLEQLAVQAEARGILEDDDLGDESGKSLGARHIATLGLPIFVKGVRELVGVASDAP